MSEFYCPRCGQKLRAKADAVGRKENCPKCAGSVTVPEPLPQREKPGPPSPSVAQAQQGNMQSRRSTLDQSTGKGTEATEARGCAQWVVFLILIGAVKVAGGRKLFEPFLEAYGWLIGSVLALLLLIGVLAELKTWKARIGCVAVAVVLGLLMLAGYLAGG